MEIETLEKTGYERITNKPQDLTQSELDMWDENALIISSYDLEIKYTSEFDDVYTEDGNRNTNYFPYISLGDLAWELKEVGTLVNVSHGKYRLLWELYQGW